MANTVTAIVPAAGIGRRMGADKPKQYLPLAGKTLLECTLDRLLTHPAIDRIIVALHPEDDTFGQLPVAQSAAIQTVVGGQERADSVLAALQVVGDSNWVLVHDAARPCVLHDDISRLLTLTEQGDTGGILAYPVRDTMKRAHPANTQLIAHTEDREGLWHALTPQLFKAEQLTDALSRALDANAVITDEASAIEWAGGNVNLVEGSASNLKVTRPEDLQLAAFYLHKQGVL